MGLNLHTGGHTVTDEQLARVITPQATATWCPVPHFQLLTQVRSEIVATGLTIREQAIALHKEGARMFGYLEVVNGHNQPDYSMVIGLRNAHDQRFPVGLAVGYQVFVCSNLSFSGEVVIKRKHTTHCLSDMPGLVNKAMGLLIERRHQQDQRIKAYKDCPLTDREAHDLMVRAIKVDIVPQSKLLPVLEQWETPAYPDFQPRTLWSLINAFTHVIKENPTQENQNRTLKLHGLCDMAAGFGAGRTSDAIAVLN